MQLEFCKDARFRLYQAKFKQSIEMFNAIAIEMILLLVVLYERHHALIVFKADVCPAQGSTKLTMLCPWLVL